MAEQFKLKYPVLDCLDHDKRYNPGDTVEMTEAEAAVLLALHVIGKPLPEEAKSEDKKAAKKDA